MSVLNSELLKKYNVAGPRYTSYPTVPYWDRSPTTEEWLSSLDQSLSEAASQKKGAAIYMHIPFCESLCSFCGCNTRITRNRKVGSPYIETILKEWSNYREKLERFDSLPITELHLGGGTPTFLTPDELKSLLDPFFSKVKVTDDHEFSLEADPRVTSRDHLRALREFGFRRVSLGIQDFDPKVQEAVHRIQSEDMVKKVVEQSRELGFTSVNFDLIYGLPFQTRKSIDETFEAVTRLKPDRIAFYSYAHVPWIKPSQRRFTEADLPNGDEKRTLYELGRERLEAAGYREVGMDHFALTTDSLWKAVENKTLHRNFMGYTSRSVHPLIAVGVSAIADSWGAFVQNEKLLETYTERVRKGEIPIHRGHLLTDEDLVLRRHVLNLMTRFETSLAGETLPFLSDVRERLSEFEKDELIDLSSRDLLKVTEKGRAFLRNVCMAFDSRLAKKAPETKLFSQTI